jgi:hypothetical protein
MASGNDHYTIGKTTGKKTLFSKSTEIPLTPRHGIVENQSYFYMSSLLRSNLQMYPAQYKFKN